MRKRVALAIKRIRLGRPAKSVIMVGLRGVGKTALLNHMLRDRSMPGEDWKPAPATGPK